jgi:polysaccharide pyruvyl transferase WcaK-like protein
MARALSEASASSPHRVTVLLTFATVSWQKGSAAQVASLVYELRKTRNDLRFRLLSQCPELDAEPAAILGIEVVDPGFPVQASRNRRSVSMLRRRVACTANSRLRRAAPWWRAGASESVSDAYTGADFILDLSGDSYRDPPGGFSVAHHATFLAALATETPYALVSQSLGPFRPWNRPLARYCVNRARLVYIRERRTREILVRLGVRTDRIQLAPDVAFGLPAFPAQPVWEGEGLAGNRIPRPWVALSVSDLALRLAAGRKDNPYLEELAKLSEHVHRKHGGSVLLVPHEITPPYYGSDDRSAAVRLLERMGKPPWMHPLRGDYDPSCLKGFIAECDFLVASRMHAAIAGLSSGIPTILLAWSHKYAGVMEEIGLDGCVWDQHAPAAPLVDLFDRLWNRRDTVRTHLLDYTSRAQREISTIIERIGDCIPGALPRTAADRRVHEAT